MSAGGRVARVGIPIANRVTSSENLLSNLSSGRLLALTAPLVIDQNVLIGYALSSEQACCANLSLNKFSSLSRTLYSQVNTPRIFHGLKRIWEFLDDRGLQSFYHYLKEAAPITILSLVASSIFLLVRY